MESRYLKYDIEELLEDRSFRDWILHGKNNEDWEKFVDNNPDFKFKLNQAKRILSLMKDIYEELEEESVLSMWQNISQYEQQQNRKIYRIKLRKAINIAASVIIIISLGFISYLYTTSHGKDYEFVSSNQENLTINNNSRLILGRGGEIVLDKDNSTVQLKEEGEIIINNDTIVNISKSEEQPNQETRYNEVIVPYGKRSEVFLSDGTKVWLNAGSRIAFPTKFTEKTRTVYLEGEACFKVFKNADHPFIVNAGQLNIEVLGTYFDVSAYDSDKYIKTVLLEGSVVVHKPSVLGLGKNSVYLKPNQKANFSKDNNNIIVSDEPNARITIAWTEGWLQFSRESLNSVLTKLERYYNVDIRVSKNFTSTELITGKLDLKESLQDVLVALADVTEIQYEIIGEEVYIDKK